MYTLCPCNLYCSNHAFVSAQAFAEIYNTVFGARSPCSSQIQDWVNICSTDSTDNDPMHNGSSFEMKEEACKYLP